MKYTYSAWNTLQHIFNQVCQMCNHYFLDFARIDRPNRPSLKKHSRISEEHHSVVLLINSWLQPTRLSGLGLYFHDKQSWEHFLLLSELDCTYSDCTNNMFFYTWGVTVKIHVPISRYLKVILKEMIFDNDYTTVMWQHQLQFRMVSLD